MNIDTKDAATGSPPPQQDQAQPATTTVKLPPIPQRKSFKPVKIPPPEALLRCTSSSERRTSFIRDVSRSTSGGGRRTSMTIAELDILQSIALDDDEEEERKSEDHKSQNEEEKKQETMRDRLQKSIMRKSTMLTKGEVKFLERLVEAEDEDVLEEHLERAVDVLENDPLYQEPRRSQSKRRVTICGAKEAAALALEEDEAVQTEQEVQQKVQRDASFRKELWDEFWSDTSSRRLVSARPSLASSGVSESSVEKKKKPEEHNGFVYFFQRALLLRDSDDEKSDTEDDTYSDSEAMEEIPFWVLGTAQDDESVHPMVLSPPMMDALRPHLPFACQQDNYWLKYSMMRHGASLRALLECVRSSARTILAIETLDGDVFGSFTSSPWRVNSRYYGSGEAFLWRLCKSRYTPCRTIDDQKLLESDIEVFGWSGKNRNVQLLTSYESDLAIGGGPPDDQNDSESEPSFVVTDADGKHSDNDWGFGLALSNDLSQGTSQFSVTFDNPPLPATQKEVFAVANIEIWTLTPVDDRKQAEILEMSRQFVFDHGNFVEA